MKQLSFISKSGLITLWVLCLLYQQVQDILNNKDNYLLYMQTLLSEKKP